MQANLADVFEYLIKKGGHWEVLFCDHTVDKVSFKEIYLYTTGININYFSWNEGKLKTGLMEDFWKVDGKTLEEWLDHIEEKQRPSKAKKTSKTSKAKKASEEEEVVEGTKKTMTVGELTSRIRRRLQQSYRHVWVRGEVCDANQSKNGNLYFSLKDEEAVLHCVLFKEEFFLYGSSVRDGVEVSVLGNLSVYPRRGSYQCIVQMALPEQEGMLASRFDRLKATLQSEGLFSAEHKKRIPPYPKRIGVITSPSGAVIHDIIRVFESQDVLVELVLYPVAVQGEWAPLEMVRMLEVANRHNFVEALVLGRGGGSQEDLSAFNNEELVRAVFASELPVVSAVGHETDLSLVDLASDFCSATPTAAAEMLAAPQKELRSRLPTIRRRLASQLSHRLEGARFKAESLSPERMEHALRAWLSSEQEQHSKHEQSLVQSMRTRLERSALSFKVLEGRLEALSPDATLDRGFSLLRKGGESGEVVSESTSLKENDLLHVAFRKGNAYVRVVSVGKSKEAPS